MSGTTAPRWRWWWITTPLCAVAYVVFLGWIVAAPWPGDAAVGRTCDRAVHDLLTTHDMVDFKRARFLVRWFNCGIASRLPAASPD